MNYNETSQWAADLGSGYSSIRPLGEGGMGTLYRAHKDSLDVDVVIKRVKQKFKGRMDERAEANILKTLKHKYLPRIYDVIESPSGYVYTIMDMIPGENMQNYVKTHGPVSQKLAYRWACQLCEVIAYLHSQVPPILHCDIKPSNIMITPNEDICVIDFNTSLVFSKGVLAIGATPGYAAPEQYTRPGASPDTIETVPLEETMPLRGYKDAFAYQNVRSNKGPSGRGVSNSVTAAQATNAGGYGTISKRTDVYGIGATLYYAITGQQPGHSLKDVRPITSYKLKFSRSFLLIIARAMKKRQEERFCDAQEMLRALQDIHAIDGRYKKVVHSQRVVAAVSLVLAVSGTLAILFGVQRIGVERYAAYDALVRKGRTAADEMRFDEAEQDLQQAIAIYDDQLEAYVEQAVLLYRQGKYQECIDAVETTQSRELKYYSRQSVANLYNVAAEAYYELESYESAATMYQKAIGYSPDILSYYQGETTALIQLGDYSGADEVLAEMAKAVPDAEQSGAYQVVQSELLRKQGDLPDALDAARKAIGSADGNDQLARAYRLAASICEDIGDSMLSEEINLLNQGIEQLPDGYYNALAGQLASAYIRQAEATGNPGYQKDALRTYQQLEKNGNTTLEVRLNIAMLQYQLHDFSKAIDGIFYPYHEDLKDVFQEMPLGNASAMMNQGLSIWKGKWSGKGHATHVSGIIGADFDNGKGICGVAPNAKLYGVDWSDSPLYRTIDKKKPTFGDGSNLYCMKIAMLYLVVEKQCQVINISQSAFGVEVRCNASNNNDDAINVINKFNEEFASFLKYVRELSKMEFIICKCANNDNNHDLFFSKDADDDFNLPYILHHKKFISISAARIRNVLRDKATGQYTIVFTPMISAQNGIMDVFMSAESQNYEASIVSATCVSCPDLKVSNNRISNLVFTANQPLRIDIQLDYHDYCSMEVKAYGNQV